MFPPHQGVVVITTPSLHSTKPETKICEGSNPVTKAMAGKKA